MLRPDEGVGVKDGPGGWIISKSEYVPVGVPIIRAMNVSENGLDLEGAVFITEEKHEELSATAIEPGDLLLTMRGSIGRAAIVPRTVPKANMNAAICRIRLRDRGLNEYLRDFLNTGPGLKQSLRHGHKAVQGDLNLGAIRSFLVPLPPKETRQRLVRLLEEGRAARRRKLEEAESLLGGLDAFVLETLGLTLPPPDGRTVYAVRLRDARRRFDPDYNSPRFRALRSKIERGKYPSEAVGNLFDPIVSGFAAGGDDQTDDPSVGVPHIRPLNISNTAELHFDGTKMVPRSVVEPGDILKQGNTSAVCSGLLG